MSTLQLSSNCVYNVKSNENGITVGQTLLTLRYYIISLLNKHEIISFSRDFLESSQFRTITRNSSKADQCIHQPGELSRRNCVLRMKNKKKQKIVFIFTRDIDLPT